MKKRISVVLCFVIAAALICGCSINIIQPSPAPSQTDRPSGNEPQPPSDNTTGPEIDPNPNPQPVQGLIPQNPKQPVFTAELIPQNTPCTFNETTYTITTEPSGEYGRNVIRLLAQEDNGWESAVNYDGSYVSAYYVKTQPEPVILLNTDFEVEDLREIYVLNAGSLAEGDYLHGKVYSIDGDVITILFQVSMLGTYPAMRDYTIASDLSMQPVGDGLYYITKDESYIPDDYYLVTTRDLQVQMYENGQFRNETLPAGTRLRVTATDGTSIVYFRTQDDREGTFPVAVNSEVFDVLINGTSAEEYFEELPYSD